MKFIIIIIVLFSLSFSSHGGIFPIPKDNEVSFDVIRKNKIIGNLTSKFIVSNDTLILHSVLDIDIKILFFPAYQFFQETRETWKNDEFIAIDGFTNFEDDREYKIDGIDKDGFFIASGMDGKLELNENIIPLNYWNKQMLNKDEVFDTQKGIVREIKVEKLDDEEIKINKQKVVAEKFFFSASKNPKDKGPFPIYTLWYYNDELLKMEFINPGDKKKNTISIIRNDWGL